MAASLISASFLGPASILAISTMSLLKMFSSNFASTPDHCKKKVVNNMKNNTDVHKLSREIEIEEAHAIEYVNFMKSIGKEIIIADYLEYLDNKRLNPTCQLLEYLANKQLKPTYQRFTYPTYDVYNDSDSDEDTEEGNSTTNLVSVLVPTQQPLNNTFKNIVLPTQKSAKSAYKQRKFRENMKKKRNFRTMNVTLPHNYPQAQNCCKSITNDITVRHEIRSKYNEIVLGIADRYSEAIETRSVMNDHKKCRNVRFDTTCNTTHQIQYHCKKPISLLEVTPGPSCLRKNINERVKIIISNIHTDAVDSVTLQGPTSLKLPSTVPMTYELNTTTKPEAIADTASILKQHNATTKSEVIADTASNLRRQKIDAGVQIITVLSPFNSSSLSSPQDTKCNELDSTSQELPKNTKKPYLPNCPLKHVSFALQDNTYCNTRYECLSPPILSHPTPAGSCLRLQKQFFPIISDIHTHDVNSDTLQEPIPVKLPLPVPPIYELNATFKLETNADTASILQQFSLLLASHCGDNNKIPLTMTYPEFADCKSMENVISAAIAMAPCKFNITKARAAHQLDPKCLNANIIISDSKFATEHGLRALLERKFISAEATALQSDVINKQFQSVSSFFHLQSIAVKGVQTSTYPTFTPNQGIDCPTYPDSIADPDILIDLLKKLHDRGQFTILPLSLIQELATNEHLLLHVSPAFIAKKQDDDRGRLVFNYSHDGPNHPAKKDLLEAHYGKISPPQLGTICQLIENAHTLYKKSKIPFEAIRRDIAGAFHCMRYSPDSSLLCASQVTINNITYGIISSVALMGDQDVNSCFNQVSIAINESLATSITSFTGSTLPLSTVATDDIIAVGPPSLIDAVHDQIGLLVGDGRQPGLCSSTSAIKQEKDLRGQCIVILGWLFNPHWQTVCPNYLTFAKIVFCIFVLCGRNPKPGQPILVGDLMLIAAHVMRASNVITPMLSFSRSFLANIRGSTDPSATVYLTTRTCSDIMFWRSMLTMAFEDSRVLFCRTSTPLLRMRLPTDTLLESRDTRSIRKADLIAYSDACTGSITDMSSPGLGGYVPGYGWFGNSYEELRYVITSIGTREDTSINILEFLALIITATLTIQLYTKMHGLARGCHFHIYCDNNTAISRARTHRSNHPIYSYLLYLLSYIQLQNGCTVGTSYHPGRLNIVADAASRSFRVTEGVQIYNKYLKHLPQFHPSRPCILGISRILSSLQHNVLQLPAPTPISLVPTTSIIS